MTDEPKRDKGGKWLPGKSANPKTQWGPENPSPKSPGRPKKMAWLEALELRLENPEMRQALADRILKTALKGGEKASLQALNMIQDRVVGPVVKRMSAEVNENCGVLVVPHGRSPEEWIAESMARNENAKRPGSDDEE